MKGLEELRFTLHSAMNKGDKEEVLRLSRILDKKIVTMMRKIIRREQSNKKEI